MKLTDVTVPIDSSLPAHPGPTHPGSAPLSLEPTCLPLRVVDGDRAPAGVVPRRR